MKCFGCDGKGKNVGIGCPGFVRIELECDGCGGTGELPAEAATWRVRGKKLRERRMEPYRNLRDEAERLGVDLMELSLMERGMRDPAGIE